MIAFWGALGALCGDLILFFFILLLEDSGYMARAAFLMDRLMGKVGLPGRAFIPLLSSYACAVPGIMATRTIASRRDRFTTILIAPLTTCSARLPVYALLIGAFVPKRQVAGFLELQGLVMFSLYVGGAVAALAVAWVLRATLFRGPRSPLLMELPTYKWPDPRVVFKRVTEQCQAFVVQAGTVILSVSILLWALGAFPRLSTGSGQALDPGAQLRRSYLGQIGHVVEPAFRPLGWDWRISMAAIASFPALYTRRTK
jgi:ferrous iron transport protein B